MADAVKWDILVPTGTLRPVPTYHRHEITALTPQAALNVAQVALDSAYGPGVWVAAKAVIEAGEGARNWIVVERVRE